MQTAAAILVAMSLLVVALSPVFALAEGLQLKYPGDFCTPNPLCSTVLNHRSPEGWQSIDAKIVEEAIAGQKMLRGRPLCAQKSAVFEDMCPEGTHMLLHPTRDSCAPVGCSRASSAGVKMGQGMGEEVRGQL